MSRHATVHVGNPTMHRFVSCGVLAVLVGCSSQTSRNASPASLSPAERTVELPEQNQSEAGVTETQAAIRERKIIYEAQVTLVVEDFSKTEREVPELVKQHSGYSAEVEVDRTQGERLSGRWVVRIPVDRYDAFLGAISKLGVPEIFNQTAQDVTEEYVDLEARIANKKRLEERILQLLEESQGAIKDVIEVERELARVRGEIEQMEGRLRFLENRTALTTVTISAVEWQSYVPAQAPTFLGRIDQAWGSSLISLRRFGEHLAVGIVFVFPWVVILAVVLAPAIWCFRFYKRRTAAGEPQQESADAADRQPENV